MTDMEEKNDDNDMVYVLRVLLEVLKERNAREWRMQKIFLGGLLLMIMTICIWRFLC